jgi:AI-2 transport protein TqsA
MNLGAATRWGLNALILLSVVLALYLARSIFIPTIIGLLLAAMLWPVAEWLHRGVPVFLPVPRRERPWIGLWFGKLRFPWTTSCTIVVIGLVALVLVMMFAFVGVLPLMVQELPRDYNDQVEVYKEFRHKLEQISPVPLDAQYFPPEADKSVVFTYIQEAIRPGSSFVGSVLLQSFEFSLTMLFEFALVMFILLFLLMEGPMLSRRVAEVFGPSRDIKTKTFEIITDMAGQIRTYLVWRTIINFALGLVVGTVYYALNLRHPWTWGLLTAVLCYIPYLGPIAAGIPPLLDAFVSTPSLWWVLAVLVFYVAIVNIEGYLLVPLLMGRHMNLNAITVILACLFWELVWGTPGLFLAMPLMAGVKAICFHIPDWRPWANLMSSAELSGPGESSAEIKLAEIFDDVQVTPVSGEERKTADAT